MMFWGNQSGLRERVLGPRAPPRRTLEERAAETFTGRQPRCGPGGVRPRAAEHEIAPARTSVAAPVRPLAGSPFVDGAR